MKKILKISISSIFYFFLLYITANCSETIKFSLIPNGNISIKKDIELLEDIGLQNKIKSKNVNFDNDENKKLTFKELPTGNRKILYGINSLNKSGHLKKKLNIANNQKLGKKKDDCIIIVKKEIIDSNLFQKIIEEKLSSTIKNFSINLVDNGLHLKGEVGSPLSIAFDTIIKIEIETPNIIDLYIKEIDIIGISMNLFRSIIFDYIKSELKINKSENIKLQLITKNGLKGIRISVPSYFSIKNIKNGGEISKIEINYKEIKLFINFF
jgi:hypothetical protein